MRNKFNDKEIKLLLDNLVVVCDTREVKEHVQKWLKSKKIKSVSKKLDYADYSAYIECNKNTEHLIARDIWFDRDICIERKKDIDELCGNLKDGATRLKAELAHLNMYGVRYFIFIEDQLFDKHLRDGKFRSKYDPKTLHARLKAIEAQYNTVIRPVSREYIGSEIYNTLKYFVRAKLKYKGFIEKDIDN